MSTPQRTLQNAETTHSPRTVPAYCAIAAVAVLLLAAISTGTAHAATADADEALTKASEHSFPGRLSIPEPPTAPQPEAAPSATSTPIGMNPSITLTVAKPDTGAVGPGGGGVIELALAATGAGQDVAWRAHARGVLATEHFVPAPESQPAPAGFAAVRLLPLAGALVVLSALLALFALRSRSDDFDEQ
ncbi:hypothetical protein [Glaciibacter sp. 2TAF33]|uniref:hypothetical protein n=1 Tax=Glaciibacter sp. 2TAF33 TaxID=3233015 RepID=UPI003F930770